MLGYLRIILASLVMLSHIDLRILGFNPGVLAVVIFYILAGKVISGLFFKASHLLIFYLERLLRIYPLYLFYSILTILFLVISNFGNPEFNIINTTLNFLIIPLNYYMYLKEHIVILREEGWWLIPPAWSLGAEIQAYFLLPLLLIHKYLRFVAFLSSFFIYMLANLGILHPDFFGYRLIPGVLFIFMFGAFIDMLQKRRLSKLEAFLFFTVYCVAIISFTLFIVFKAWKIYTIETLLGIIIGVPLVFFLSKIRLPFSMEAGSLAYGIFLSHFLAIWIAKSVNLEGFLFYLFVIFASFVLAFLGLIVEVPLYRIRFKMLKI